MMLLNPLCLARKRSSRRFGSLLLLPLVILAIAGASPDSYAARRETTLQQVSASQEPEYFSRVATNISLMLPKTGRLPGQSFPSAVRITRSEKMIQVELGRAFIPAGMTDFDPDLQKQLQGISNEIVTELLETNIQFEGIEFTFEKQHLDHYFPADFSSEEIIEDDRQFKSASAVSTVVVVSAGHGLTYYPAHTSGSTSVEEKWAYQRPNTGTNGIQQEDLLTTEFSAHLKPLLEERGDNIDAKEARSVSDDTHSDSSGSGTFKWWQISARYNLEKLYPNNTFWEKTSNKTYMKYEKQDINSRPGFANFLKADALINIHINAQAGGNTARGTRVYYNSKLAQNKTFAENIKCYMKEIINSDENYSDWSVNTVLDNASYGENNESDVKAALVEVGFDTNVDDATAMKDPAFQELAMKGVEKGYRLTKEGKDCVPFAVSSIPDVSGPRDGANIPANINFLGFPQFPVTRKIKFVDCPSGSTCTGGTSVYSDKVPSPLTFNFHCTGSSSTSVVYTWSTTLTDADGVATEPVEHKLTCTPTPSVTTKANTAGDHLRVGASADAS